MRHTMLFCAFLLLYMSGIACLNAYYRAVAPMDAGKLNLKYLLGWQHQGESESYFPYWSHGFEDPVHQERDQLLNSIRRKGVNLDIRNPTWKQLQTAIKKIDFRILSNLAMLELKIGNRENALKLLQELCKAHPREYNIVANLGTAYEVTGDDMKALEYIRKAVAINPLSHYGSEWIHVRILEEKLSKNPDYSKIINLKAGEFESWLKSEPPIQQPIHSLQIQLAYQLHERISFIAPQNPIVGQLVLDFADLVTWKKQTQIKDAIGFYEYALKYDSALKNKIDSRLNYLVPKPSAKPSTNSKSNKESGDTSYIWAILAVIVLLGALLWFWKRS